MAERQVLDLLDELRADYGLTIAAVTHDLRVARGRADRVLFLDPDGGNAMLEDAVRALNLGGGTDAEKDRATDRWVEWLSEGDGVRCPQCQRAGPAGWRAVLAIPCAPRWDFDLFRTFQRV